MILIFLLNLYAKDSQMLWKYHKKNTLLFINDTADDIQSLVRLFADDSSLMFSSTNSLGIKA
jgi:threonine synthase